MRFATKRPPSTRGDRASMTARTRPLSRGSSAAAVEAAAVEAAAVEADDFARACGSFFSAM
jgi:hypothetical protein